MKVHVAPMIIPAEFPELKMLVWNRDVARAIPAEEAFALYERNWRFVDVAHLTAHEAKLIRDLTDAFGKGFMLGS